MKALNIIFILEIWMTLITFGCGDGNRSFDQYDNFASGIGSVPTGYIIVTSNSNGTTGPGVISIWTPSGALDRVVYDYTKVGTGYASGLALLPDGLLLAISDTGGSASNDFLDLFNYSTPLANPTNLFSSLSSGAAATYMRQMDVVADSITSRYFVFAAESGNNRVTRLSSPIANTAAGFNFSRDFNFSNNGTCTLTTPYGVATIPGTTNVAIIHSAATGRVNIMDYNGTCIGSASATGMPTGVAYHRTSGKLIVTYPTSSAIFAHSATTGSASPVSAIYTSPAQLSTPRAIATDSNGYIYVSSDGLDQVLKLYWDGVSASATFLGTVVPTSVFTQNITSITVAP